MLFQTCKSFVRLQNKDILYENREACDGPIDCQVKSMKDIVKIVPSAISGSIWI